MKIARGWLWALLGLSFVLPQARALAHVKWFADYSFADPPLGLAQVLTPTFLALAALSFVVIGALVFLDRRISDMGWYQRVLAWVNARKHTSLLFMRVATGATLLLSWEANSLLVPELTAPNNVVGWVQFVLALLLIFERSTPLAGIGVFALYGVGVAQYGLFHMLDYLHYLGAAYFLIVGGVANVRLRESALPAMYATVGLSLIWLGLEKVVYPGWGLYILEQNPQLTLGLPPQFFLTAAAFVEIALGYLLIIALLERPLAIVITLVFFTTTLFFGRVEVIGHTLLHAMLIVFLLNGPGEVYRAPITFHRRLPLRAAFASVNFLIVLAVLLVPYLWGAQRLHQAYVSGQAVAPQTTPAPDDTVPPPLVTEEVPAVSQAR